MCHPFHNVGGRRIRQQVGPRMLPVTFISIRSLVSSVMSKWRCGSHHTELQQSTFPGDSWLAHPALRRVVAPAHRGRVRDMNGMFFWHEWRSDNDIPTLAWWCSVITIPLAPLENRDVPSTRWNISLYQMVCVDTHWNSAGVVVWRSFLTGDKERVMGKLPPGCISHITIPSSHPQGSISASSSTATAQLLFHTLHPPGNSKRMTFVWFLLFRCGRYIKRSTANPLKYRD